MNVYIYQAALWCETCGKALREKLTCPGNLDDEHTYDSDDYPKGPYPNGGGEADSPQHCDGCDTFLKNPLTADGHAYAAEVKVKPQSWKDFYGI